MENCNSLKISTTIRKKPGYLRKNTMIGILFVAPAVLGFIIFVLGPMISSLLLSFTDYALVNQPKFIGFENYSVLFNGEDPYFYKSLSVTIYYVVLSVPLGLIFAFFLATMLNKDIRGKSFFRTIFYIPSIVPVIASSMIWVFILDPDLGMLNNVLRLVHLPTSKWLYDEVSVIPTLALMSLWTVGGPTIIFLAGLQNVPRSFYEACEIDGGNSFYKLWFITIPMLTPTIFFNLIMGIIGGMQTFTQSFIMTNGGPNNASLFYTFYLYRQAFRFSNMGSACAIAWILFIIVAVLTIIAFKSSNKWVYYEGDDK